MVILQTQPRQLPGARETVDDDARRKLLRELRRIRVQCDENCGAYKQPETVDELQKAYEHWRNHDYRGGCSHGY
jgi:hypothetical protein